MSDLLKGNFETKKKVVDKTEKSEGEKSLKHKLKEAAMASIGGSMVYVERTDLGWDGEEEDEKESSDEEKK